MIRLVPDTNVLVSANLNPEGLEAVIVALVLNKKAQLCVSGPILDEYERVLRYLKLKFVPNFPKRWKTTVVVNARELLGLIGNTLLG